MKILNKYKVFILLVGILILAAYFRFHNLGGIPAGIQADEASQGYNAFSLFKTGKDMYGQRFPILFRANGSYQPPIYTYFSIIPVHIFGNTIFSARFISALSGVLLVFLTYLFMRLWGQKGLVAAVVIALAPWAIHFSRLAVEANLAATIFVSSLVLFTISIKKPILLPVAAFFLGLSTQAYYSERIIALLFLPIFILMFRNTFFKNKKVLITALIVFGITLIPHLLILSSGALTKRLSQVSYLGNGSILRSGQEFLNQIYRYYSPNNLFFNSDSNLGRTSPELSVFYDWLVVPFLFGLRYLFKKRKETFSRLIFLIILLTPIPAALTGDVFYPLRTLDLLWVFSIVIALGIYEIWNILKSNFIRIPVFIILLGYSVVSLYISYFVLFKYEEAHNYGYAYIKLIDTVSSSKYKDRKIWLDYTGRAWGAGIRMAYLTKMDPLQMQSMLSSQQQTPYYSGIVNTGEIFTIGNVVIKEIDWGKICGNLIVVGDYLSISPEQVKNHNLKEEFEINDLTGKPELFGYSTKTICRPGDEK